MEKLEDRLEKYKLYITTAHSNIGYELANEYKQKIMEDLNIDENKFREIYKDYLK